MTYCIKSTSTLEIVLDNLTEKEAIEAFSGYEDLLGTGSVFIAEDDMITDFEARVARLNAFHLDLMESYI